MVEEGFKEMKIKNGDSSDEEALSTIVVERVKQEPVSQNGTPSTLDIKSATQSPKKYKSGTQSPVKAESEHEEVVGGEITVKLEPGQPPKLARSASKKVIARSAPLFDHYEDKTEEATGVFQVITECAYSAKYLGSTEHAMECDCAEEWGKINIPYSTNRIASPVFSNTKNRIYRCLDERESCLWRRLGLYQSRHQNGVFRRLRVRL